jgi:hypothetical protein
VLYIPPKLAKKRKIWRDIGFYTSPNMAKIIRFGEIYSFIFRQNWPKKERFGRL